MLQRSTKELLYYSATAPDLRNVYSCMRETPVGTEFKKKVVTSDISLVLLLLI